MSEIAALPEQTGPTVIGSLSPSRAGDFMVCPLLYRFRVIDRLPEPPSRDAVRGSLVHAVLERLFDLPAGERTAAAAAALVEPVWTEIAEQDDELTALFATPEDVTAFLSSAGEMLTGYFLLEDPRRLEPAERECRVEAVLPSGLALRGYIDRLDRAPDGALRVVDYKTGKAPVEMFEGRALFQLKFYALVLWRTTGVVPRLLQLLYLGDREVLRYSPDEADLRATERKLEALWAAIDRATRAGDWRARPGRLCEWCSFQSLCPAYGGTPPPLPEPATEVALVG